MERPPLWTRLKHCAFTESTYFTINRPEYVQLVAYQLSTNIMTVQSFISKFAFGKYIKQSTTISSLPSNIAYKERKDKTVEIHHTEGTIRVPLGYPCCFLCTSHINAPACSAQRPQLKSSSSLHIGWLRYVSSVMHSNWVNQFSVYVRVS